MDVTSIGAFQALQPYENSVFQKKTDGTNEKSFDLLFQSAIDMIKETASYTDAAEEAEISFALGINKSPADLQAAQTKANLSLQYTVAVRNAVMDAYREIMQISF